MKNYSFYLTLLCIFSFVCSAADAQTYTIEDINFDKLISLECVDKSYTTFNSTSYEQIFYEIFEYRITQASKTVVVEEEVYDSLLVSCRQLEGVCYVNKIWHEELDSLVMLNLSKQKKLSNLFIKSTSQHLNSFDFSSLPSLQKLEIINNSQEFSWPKNIHKLKKLQVLKIEGKIEQLAPEIASMTQLISLDLSNNRLTELPSSIGRLKNLQHINVANNNITNLPEEINKLTQLISLNASDNPLKEIKGNLNTYSNMSNLNLSNTYIDNPQSIKILKATPKLEYLNLSNTKITIVPYELLNKEYLVELDLSKNEINYSFSKINLPLITSLNLNKTRTSCVSDSIVNYTMLRTLKLNYSELMFLSSDISTLKHLSTVELFETKVAFTYVQNCLTNEQIKSYSLARTYYYQLKDVDPLTVTAVTLSFQQIIELGEQLERFKNLQSIKIDNQNIHDTDLFVAEFDALSFHTKLSSFRFLIEYAYCYFDYLDGKSYINLEGIDHLKNIRKVDLSGTTLSEIPSELFSLTKLESLIMRNCGLRKIPQGLDKFPQLKIVDFQNVTNTDGYDHYNLNSISHTTNCQILINN
jgi:internalin A